MRNDSDDIRRYREGSMTDAERHALEKKALGDPFLADALEGTESITTEELKADLTEFSSAILPQRKKPVFSPIRIAAGVVMILGASLFYFFDQADQQPIALQEKNVPAAGDSATVSHDTSQLLTMAKPEEEVAGAASSQPSVRLEKADESTRKGKTPTLKPSAITAGPGVKADADDSKTEKTEAEEVLLAEEKETRTAEDKKVSATEAAPTLSSTEGAGALAERDKVAKRSVVSRSSGLTKDVTVAGRTVSGTVTSAGDGAPLPGVNVVIKGTSAGTVTDASGRYALALPTENAELVFSFIGLQTNEVQTGKKEVVDVQLGEDVSQLSEVVVVGYARSSAFLDEPREPVVKMAAPLGGLRAYNKYLETNLHYPEEAVQYKVKGRVTIMFTVETTGQLSDFNVVRGLGHGCDEEVIRLVKEGPKWSPSTKDDVPLESEVRVRLKFDPAMADK